jgi:hypothetical protein
VQPLAQSAGLHGSQQIQYLGQPLVLPPRALAWQRVHHCLSHRHHNKSCNRSNKKKKKKKKKIDFWRALVSLIDMNGLSPRSILSEQVDVLALKQRAQASSRRVGKYEAEFWAQQWQQQLKEGDDMLFFVDNPDREKTEGFADVGPGFFVRRKGGASVPRLGCEEIDWESTFFLNVICNAFEFKLVVTARGKDPTVIVEKCASVVFASPHLAAAAESKEQQRCSFPLLSFQVHDYASVGSVTMCAERTLGVELFARGTLFGEKVDNEKRSFFFFFFFFFLC